MLVFPRSSSLSRSLYERLPKYPLCLTVWDDRNGVQFAFSEAGDGVGGEFEVEDRLLDVGGEVGDLRDSSAGIEICKSTSANRIAAGVSNTA